jgi:F-type H+-transporting ATPase subunit a
MKNRIAAFSLFGMLLISVGLSAGVGAADVGEGDFKDHMSDFIIHHVMDDYKWHIGGSAYLYLPFIAYHYESHRLDVFSTRHLFKGPYRGYELDHGKVFRADGTGFFNISITKNVLALFISSLLLMLIFISIARAYKRRTDMVPRGFQSVMEPVILFIRDEIARPSIGDKHYERFSPYLLTLFFFILINNFLGLVPFFPGGANLSGNIATTMTLALFTLVTIMISGNRHYWKHIFWPPGVPVALKPPIAAIEFFGIFTKPFALMIRLFANITGGHIIILSIISIIFVFKSYAVGAGISFFVLFMSFIELLVALLQAYIFTMLSAIFIGQAVDEPEHH